MADGTDATRDGRQCAAAAMEIVAVPAMRNLYFAVYSLFKLAKHSVAAVPQLITPHKRAWLRESTCFEVGLCVDITLANWLQAKTTAIESRSSFVI